MKAATALLPPRLVWSLRHKANGLLLASFENHGGGGHRLSWTDKPAEALAYDIFEHAWDTMTALTLESVVEVVQQEIP